MIDHIIPASILEVIPVKIAAILKKEFANQAYQFGDTTFVGLKIMSERTTPVDKVETDMITIMTASGDYSLQSVGSMHATPYTFILEFITKAKTTPLKRGDEAAGARLNKLIMQARYILMSPTYLNLGFTEQVIENTAITKMQIYKEERTDTANTAIGQLLFTVYCEEISEQNQGIALAGSDTSVKLGLTEQGYEYTQP